MNGLNSVQVIGNLGRDPELRHTKNGTAVVNISLAINSSWMKDGQKQQETEWVYIVVWQKLAEVCDKYLKKGDPVYFSGKMKTSQYEDKEGNKRYKTEVVAREMIMLGSKGGDSNSRQDEGSSSQFDDREEPPF